MDGNFLTEWPGQRQRSNRQRPSGASTISNAPRRTAELRFQAMQVGRVAPRSGMESAGDLVPSGWGSRPVPLRISSRSAESRCGRDTHLLEEFLPGFDMGAARADDRSRPSRPTFIPAEPSRPWRASSRPLSPQHIEVLCRSAPQTPIQCEPVQKGTGRYMSNAEPNLQNPPEGAASRARRLAYGSY